MKAFKPFPIFPHFCLKERQKFSLGFQSFSSTNQSTTFFGVHGVRAKRPKGAVGGRGEEKARSALLQNSKQKNSVVVQCVAN